MTPREIVLEQIYHRETETVPYTLPFEEDVGKRMDQHYGGTAWREEITPYIVSCGLIDRHKRVPISDTHTRDGFGTVWRMDRRPHHLEEPGLKEPSFEGYDFPTADVFANPTLKEDAEKVRETYPNSFTLINMGWGLWESYWGIRGFENAMMDCVAEPDFFEEVMDRLTDLYLAQVAMCADIEADALMVGDDWGDQRDVMMGPDRWRQYLKPRWAKIYQAVHERGKIAMSHCCGSVVDIMPDIIEIGLDVIESVQPKARGMNPYELKKKWGDKITFWGGLCSQQLIPFGTPDEIRDEVQRLCNEMGREGGYILGPAKSLQPETPIPNALAVIEAFTRQG